MGFFQKAGDWLGDAFTGRVDRADTSGIDAVNQQATALRQQFLNALPQYQSAAPQVDELMFRKAAEGQGGPSAAALQLQQGQAQNLQNQMAFAASQRGAYSPAVARQAISAGAEGQQQVNQQAAVLRAQEQQQARQNLMQVQQSNMQSYLQNQGQNYESQNQLRGLAAGTLGTQQQGAATIYSGQQQANNQQSAARGQIFGGILGAGGAAAAAYIGKPKAAAHGGFIEGVAPVSGDHPANDIVPAVLSPGELVVPRTVVAKGPSAIANFAQKEVPEFGAVMASANEFNKRLAALEAKKGKKSA